jgi:hypothetical protein
MLENTNFSGNQDQFPAAPLATTAVHRIGKGQRMMPGRHIRAHLPSS